MTTKDLQPFDVEKLQVGMFCFCHERRVWVYRGKKRGEHSFKQVNGFTIWKYLKLESAKKDFAFMDLESVGV